MHSFSHCEPLWNTRTVCATWLHIFIFGLAYFQVISGLIQSLLINYGLRHSTTIGNAFEGALTTSSACFLNSAVLMACYFISEKSYRLIRTSLFVSKIYIRLIIAPVWKLERSIFTFLRKRIVNYDTNDNIIYLHVTNRKKCKRSYRIKIWLWKCLTQNFTLWGKKHFDSARYRTHYLMWP